MPFLLIAFLFLNLFSWADTPHATQSNFHDNAYNEAVAILEERGNTHQAISLLIISSEKGNAHAAYLIGDIMRENATERKDYEAVISYYSQADKLGLATAKDAQVEVALELQARESNLATSFLRFDFNNPKVDPSYLKKYRAQAESGDLSSQLALALILWQKGKLDESYAALRNASLMPHGQAKLLEIVFLSENNDFGNAMKAYKNLRDNTSFTEIMELSKNGKWLQFVEGLIKDVQELEAEFIAKKMQSEKREKVHLQKYGYMFAERDSFTQEDIKDFIARLEQNNDTAAAEALMYAYWNNRMGVSMDLEKTYYYALRAQTLGSPRGAIVTAILEYTHMEEDKKQHAIHYLRLLDKENKTKKTLFELYQADPFISQLSDFKKIFEAYKKSPFYIKR